MRKIFGWIFTIGGAVLWILDRIGAFQTAQELIENRSWLVKLFALATTSQWIPIGIFAVGIFLLVWIQLGFSLLPATDAPEITPFETRVNRVGDEFKLTIGVKNTGKTKAIDTQITSIFWRCSGTRKPFTVQKSNGNPISPDVPEQVELYFSIEPLEPVFVVISFAFRSRENGKLREQRPSYYYRWDGQDVSLTHVSREERERIVSRLKKGGIPSAVEFDGRALFHQTKRSANDARKTENSRKEPQPLLVAIDELKELRDEGENMLLGYSFSEFPADEAVEDFLSRSLETARQKVLADHIKPADVARLQETWEEEELLLKKAALHDAGISEFSPHGMVSFLSIEFDRLYSRVKRLRELLTKIEGTDTGSRPPVE